MKKEFQFPSWPKLSQIPGLWTTRVFPIGPRDLESPWFHLFLFVAAHADTAEVAIEILAVGTPEYRFGRIDSYRAQQIMSGLYVHEKETGEKIQTVLDKKALHVSMGPCILVRRGCWLYGEPPVMQGSLFSKRRRSVSTGLWGIPPTAKVPGIRTFSLIE
jgi:hypothetical protein